MDIFLDDVVESTEPTDEREVLSRLFLVFDRRNGNVVHVHKVVGDAQFVADDAHSRMAMQMATNVSDGEDLQILPVPTELDVQEGVALRVDVSTNQIIAVKVPSPSLKDFEERLQKERRSHNPSA